MEPAAERFELVDLPGGVGKTLRLADTKQVFHPVIGPVAEAERIHLAGTRLVARANAHDPAGNGHPFTVWDVGLGAAANALTALAALRDAGRPGLRVHVCSFDRTLAPLEFALRHADALSYPRGHEDTLRRLAADGAVRLDLPGGGELDWTMHAGDFAAQMPQVSTLAHAVFFDPYSPAANAEMWTLELFAALRQRAAGPAGGGCLLTTYTRSTAVRVTLLLAGWHVGAGAATGEKDETTVAASDLALLERPLGSRWLEKVWASANAAPRRAGQPPEARGPIHDGDYAALKAHPQFTVTNDQ